MKDKTIQKLEMLKKLPAARPDKLFIQNTRVRVLNRVTSGVPIKASSWWHSMKSIVAQWAVVGFTGSVLCGTTVVYAAQYSKPGSTLYPVRLASENAAVLLAPAGLKTQVATSVIDRRAADIESSTTGMENTQKVRSAVHAYTDLVVSLEHERNIDQTEVTRHVTRHAKTLKKYLSRDIRGDEHSQNADAADRADENSTDSSKGTAGPTGTTAVEETGTLHAGSDTGGEKTDDTNKDSSKDMLRTSGRAVIQQSSEHELNTESVVVGSSTSSTNDAYENPDR